MYVELPIDQISFPFSMILCNHVQAGKQYQFTDLINFH